MDYKLLGSNIRSERIKQNFTQEVLSEKAGISSVFLSQIENNRNIPSFETVYNLSLVLNVTLDSLVTDNKESKKFEPRIELLLKDRTEKEKSFVFEVIKHLLSKIDKEKIQP